VLLILVFIQYQSSDYKMRLGTALIHNQAGNYAAYKLE